jgi:photosystem II stability/assembly factor-like uncharacterized protein
MSTRIAEFDTAPLHRANCVVMFGGGRGCAVGLDGCVLMTSDGGARWLSAKSAATVNDLWDCAFADDLHGWACGERGTIIATSDGGVRWSRQTSGTTSDLNSITFTDALHGSVRDVRGMTLATDDGGATWLRTDEFSAPLPNTPDPD